MLGGKLLTILSILHFILWMEIGGSPDELTDLLQIINDKVRVYPDTKNKYFTDVISFFERYVWEYRIYTYNSTTNKKSMESKINMFFIQINCKFADWILYQLFDCIQIFPSILKLNSNEHTIELDFENNAIKLITIEEYVERFVNVLHHFLHLFGSYYDTSLLNTLILVQFQMEYILNYIDKEELTNISYDIIIKIFLEIMIAVQNFKSTNCPMESKLLYSEFTNELKMFYDFWILIPKKTITDNFGYLNFLENDYKLKSSLICNINQSLLESVMGNEEKTSAILNEIFSTVVVFYTEHATYKNTIKEVFNKVRHSQDLELIFFYTKSIFNTIMKLICTKTLKVLEAFRPKIRLIKKKCNFPNAIIETFALIDSLILYGTNHSLPNNLTSRFTNLAANKICAFDDIKKTMKLIQNYLDSIQNIELPTAKFRKSTLTMFIDTINQFADDFKCFKRLSEFLHWEYSKYYIPFINNPIKIYSLMNSNDKIPSSQTHEFNIDLINSNKQCKYVSDFRSLCKRINQLSFSRYVEDKIKYQTILKSIKNISLNVINQHRKNKDRDFLKMSSNIYILLELNFTVKNEENVKPLLSLIVANLHSYYIKYCGKSSKGYLEFNNKSSKEDELVKYLDAYIDTCKTDNVKSNFMFSKVLNVISFYNENIQNASVFEYYGKKLIFFWKGEKKNIYDIFENINSIILNPTHVLAFYDVYFKFITTILYYEITVIFNRLKIECTNVLLSTTKIKTNYYNTIFNIFVDCITEDNYPNFFSEFLAEIKLLLYYVFDELYGNLIKSNLSKSRKINTKMAFKSKNSDVGNINEQEFINKSNNIFSKVNNKIKDIEKLINDYGIFTFDTTNSNVGYVKQLSLTIENMLPRFSFKATKIHETLYLTTTLCHSVKSVNNMIQNFIIHI